MKTDPAHYLDLDGTVRQITFDALVRFVNVPEDVLVFPVFTELTRISNKARVQITGVSRLGGLSS